MEAFRSTLVDYDLTDLGYMGNWYTRQRRKFASTNIREKLDHGVANPTWWTLFPDFSVSHLLHSISDHCPLLVTECETVIRDFRVFNNNHLSQKLSAFGTISNIRVWR